MKLSSNVVLVLSLISGHVDMPEMSSLPDVCLARDLAVECLFRMFFVGDVAYSSTVWPEGGVCEWKLQGSRFKAEMLQLSQLQFESSCLFDFHNSHNISGRILFLVSISMFVSEVATGGTRSLPVVFLDWGWEESPDDTRSLSVLRGRGVFGRELCVALREEQSYDVL